MGPEADGQQQPGILCREGAQGHSLHLQVQLEDEEQAGTDVHQVLQDGYQHGVAGVLHPDEPPDEAVQSQGGGSPPDADMEVAGGQLLHFRAGLHEVEGRQADGCLQHDERHGQQEAEAHRAQQDAGGFGEVLLSVSLGGQSAGPHAQESEDPVNHAEQHAAHGNGTDVGGGAQMADNADIHQP